MGGREPELGTTWKCGQHGRLAIPVLYEGEPRIRHAGACDTDWCRSQRLIERQVREVARETVLAALTLDSPQDSR